MMANYDFGFKPIKIKPINLYGQTQKSSNGKRTLGIRDKQILYQRAKAKCEACNKKIEFSEMQTGHKTAASKGGRATLSNSVCLCYRCNKLQGTDSWATFMKKMGKSNIRSVTSSKKRSLSRKKSTKRKQSNAYGIPQFKIPKFKF